MGTGLAILIRDCLRDSQGIDPMRTVSGTQMEWMLQKNGRSRVMTASLNTVTRRDGR